MRVRRWMGLLAVLCLAASLIVPASAAADTPPGTLITGVTVSYSSNDGDPGGHPAGNAIDGDVSTWWSSYPGVEAVLNLDLGAEYWVSGIEVLVQGTVSQALTLWGESAGRADAVGYGGWPGPITDGTSLQQTTTYQPFPMRYVSVVLSTYWRNPAGVYEVRVYGTPALHYDFTGFFAPVDTTMLNVAKAGSAIPVKFSLGGDQGLDIFAVGYPKVVRLPNCPVEVPDPIEDYVVASASGLQYDAVAAQYTYVWKTMKGATGCYELQMQLADGSLHSASFQFK